ncbi:MAG: hypothetical protein ACLGXA_10465 [Acidobacteriota bacterium]
MARYEFGWDPENELSPRPCIDIELGNSRELVACEPDFGFDYPDPLKVKALLDTGASLTVISKTLAKSRKLFATGANTEVRVLEHTIRCPEYAAAIGFPGGLRSFDPIRVRAADFEGERTHAVLIGTDIMRFWKITFDGRSKLVIIED